ncbi:Heme oxygenase [Corynebacterium cystitidis DSM 20524]|uniref:Heme oxygenase n=2 Tax=Corynebacterium cystitidis TaxID=35757 RepID=A0A1H9UVN3_9CORY|nr:Heme oxygenase [Corynebacterium cystitidis DSM 20524]SES13401.1 heme oxygenase [Corynebacterium cystitidis DSM 20524]SNV91297.1 Heme oxygenase [Corynebacterium cystitidis]
MQKGVSMTSTTATSLSPTPSTELLSVALRNQTAKAHEAAEGSAFMQMLLNGQLDKDSVVQLHGQYWAIYPALDAAMAEAAVATCAAAIYDPRLERTAALEHDLHAMCGDAWRDEIVITPATKRYVERLEQLRLQISPLVIAQHYVRYLGDLSGGQVIRRCLGRDYGIPESSLTFYDFSAVGKIPTYRNQYRQKLDELALNDEARARLVEEAQYAFRLNQEMFADLQRVSHSQA